MISDSNFSTERNPLWTTFGEIYESIIIFQFARALSQIAINILVVFTYCYYFLTSISKKLFKGLKVLFL
jgi:hypothetical protein